MPIRYRRTQPAIFTVADVQKHLKRFAIAEGLQVMNRLSRRLCLEQPTPGMVGVEISEEYTITEWDLAFIAKELILCSNDHRSGRLNKDAEAVRHALFLVSNMRDPVLRGEGGITNKQGLYSLVRIAYQQFRHQGWWQDALPRTYLLYEKTWRRMPSGFDLEQASLEVLGVPVTTFLALGTVLYGLAGAKTFASFLPVAVSNIDPMLEGLKCLITEDIVRNLWPRVASDYAGFREIWEKRREHDSSYARFEFNPLEVRPVILTQQPVRCIVPSLSSLLLRFTDGIYHDFFNHYDRLGDPGTFTIPFGGVFQEYVGWQLRTHYGDGPVISDRLYRIGRQEWRGPDWIVVEGDRAILIECKAARLKLPGKVTGDEAAIEDDVRNKLVPAIAKFPKKIAHLRSRPDVYPELRDVTRFYPVVVTLDPWWPAESFHQTINEELVRQGLTCDPYHVISIDTLEDLMPLAAAGARLSDILEERIKRGQQGYSFGPDLAVTAREIGGVRPNKLLDEAFHSFFAPILPPGIIHD